MKDLELRIINNITEINKLKKERPNLMSKEDWENVKKEVVVYCRQHKRTKNELRLIVEKYFERKINTDKHYKISKYSLFSKLADDIKIVFNKKIKKI